MDIIREGRKSESELELLYVKLAGDPTGNDVDVIVPAGEKWEVHSIYISYEADATVGDRIFSLELRHQNPARSYWEIYAENSITASQNALITCAPSLAHADYTPASIIDRIMHLPLPNPCELKYNDIITAMDKAGASGNDLITVYVWGKKR